MAGSVPAACESKSVAWAYPSGPIVQLRDDGGKPLAVYQWFMQGNGWRVRHLCDGDFQTWRERSGELPDDPIFAAVALREGLECELLALDAEGRPELRANLEQRRTAADRAVQSAIVTSIDGAIEKLVRCVGASEILADRRLLDHLRALEGLRLTEAIRRSNRRRLAA